MQQSNLQKARTQVDKFLQRPGIHSDSFDVKAAKTSSGGLYRTFPVHLAAKRETGTWFVCSSTSVQTPCSGTAAEPLLSTAWGRFARPDKSSDRHEVLKKCQGNLTNKGTAAAQIAFSSMVLLNKTDLVKQSHMKDVELRVREMDH